MNRHRYADCPGDIVPSQSQGRAVDMCDYCCEIFEPEFAICVLAGTDDHLVTVTHPDGRYITFRVDHDPTVGQFTSYDVSYDYADYGHDSCEDRDFAQRKYRTR